MIKYHNKSLPKGWQWVRLDDVCESKIINRDPRREPDSKFVYVDITSIDASTKTIIEPKHLFGKDAPSRARQVIQTGDVIVSTTRPNLNAVAKITQEFDKQICSTGFCVLRSNQAQLDSDFLFHFVRTKEFIQSLSDLVKGALYPAVTDKDVRAQFIPLPPLDEQRRIASRLNEQLAAVESARKAAEEQLHAARQLPSAYLRGVFNEIEKALPKRWRWVKLAEICQFKRGPFGGSLKKDIFVSSGYKVYEQQHAIQDNFEIGRYYITEEKYKAMEGFAIKPNDLIVSCSGTMGRIAIVPSDAQPGIINQALLKLTPNLDLISPSYLRAYLQSESVQKKYFLVTSGTAIQNVAPVSELKQIKVPLPPIPEQEALIVALQERFMSSKSIIALLESQLAEINRLPASLLREAFAGQG